MRFDNDFYYDEWEFKMRQKDILDNYFGEEVYAFDDKDRLWEVRGDDKRIK